jgi:hypothetical protein
MSGAFFRKPSETDMAAEPENRIRIHSAGEIKAFLSSGWQDSHPYTGKGITSPTALASSAAPINSLVTIL